MLTHCEMSRGLPRSLLTLLLVSSVAHAASAVPPQLHLKSFAACLREAAPFPDLEYVRIRHDLGAFDLLLPYLAFYPGARPPAPFDEPQVRAHRRWAENWAWFENELALKLAGGERTSPADLLKFAAARCDGVFCGALVVHNTLRALGRNHRGGPNNPAWFEDNHDFWLAQVEPIRAKLFPLRASGRGDRYGEWYHFFGVLTFALRDAALHGDFKQTELAVRLNDFFNPVLVGKSMPPEKARLDRDYVDVVRTYLSDEAVSPVAPCSDREAYVASPGG